MILLNYKTMGTVPAQCTTAASINTALIFFKYNWEAKKWCSRMQTSGACLQKEWVVHYMKLCSTEINNMLLKSSKVKHFLKNAH